MRYVYISFALGLIANALKQRKRLLEFKPVSHQKPCSRWVLKTCTNNMKCTWPRIPDANYILLARVGGHVGYTGARVGSANVSGYQHVGIGNAKTQCEGFRVAVEYRLFSDPVIRTI